MKCDNDAHELSKFCRDHMEDVVTSGWRGRRFRLVEILALVSASVLLWVYPKYEFKGWLTDYVDETAASEEPSLLQPVARLLANLVGEPGEGEERAAGEADTPGGGGAGRVDKEMASERPRRCDCGNGLVEAGEQCDGDALGGATCASLGFSGDCGDAPQCVRSGLACLTSCVFDYSGCTSESRAEPLRFALQRDGTIIDRLTGLVWEAKCSGATCSEDHDVHQQLAWADAARDWVARLNRDAYAGYSDWRLPSVAELRSLLQDDSTCESPPCVPAALAGEHRTASAPYWSATSFSLDTTRAWLVSFADGKSFTVEKNDAVHVRAVRRGS